MRAASNQVAQGLRVPGNIKLAGRPVVANEDGTVSTELSFSRGTDQGEVLVPRVVNGQMLSEDAAWQHYKDTREHLGIFDTPENADAYAEKIHNRTMTNANGSTNYEANAAIRPAIAPTPVPQQLKSYAPGKRN